MLPATENNLKTPTKQKSLSKSEVYSPEVKFEEEVKNAISRIEDNLLAVKVDKNENYDEELSFDLSDDEDVRLTSAKNEEEEIVDTYKIKLEELIKWMACKYSPNMESTHLFIQRSWREPWKWTPTPSKKLGPKSNSDHNSFVHNIHSSNTDVKEPYLSRVGIFSIQVDISLRSG